MPGQSQPRAGGRFAANHDDLTLIELVGEVIRDHGFAASARISTRTFDAAAAEHPQHRDTLPSARQIATRLSRPWDEIVAVARGAPGAPTPPGAVRAWRRAEENPNLDERNVVFAFGLIARELDSDSFTPDRYEAAVSALLHTASRDGRRDVLEPLLPTVGQVLRIFDDWDVALASAGLRPHPGVELTQAGLARAAEVWRRANGHLTPAPQAAADAPDSPPVAAPSNQPQPPAPDSGSRPARASDDQPLTTGRARGGHRRTHRKPLSVVEAIVIFWQSQGGWPKKPGVLVAWAEMVNTSTQDVRRHDWDEVLREADREITRLNGGEWPGRRWISRAELNPDAPLPAELPERLDRDITERDCIDAVKKWLTEGLRAGERPTHARYRQWEPGKHGAPSLSAINKKPGRFAAILRRAQAELAVEPRG